MNLLLLGGGGREHALAWKLRQSPLVTKLVAAPGNPGIAALAECVPVTPTDAAAVVASLEPAAVGSHPHRFGRATEALGRLLEREPVGTG